MKVQFLLLLLLVTAVEVRAQRECGKIAMLGDYVQPSLSPCGKWMFTKSVWIAAFSIPDLKRLDIPNVDGNNVDISSNGKWFAYTDFGVGGCTVWWSFDLYKKIGERWERQNRPVGEYDELIGFVPETEQLVVKDYRSLLLIDAPSGRTIDTFNYDYHTTYGMELYINGQTGLFAGSTATWLNLKDLSVTGLLNITDVTLAAFSPEGKQVALLRQGFDSVWIAEVGALNTSTSFHIPFKAQDNRSTSLAWSEKGIAVARNDSGTVLIDPKVSDAPQYSDTTKTVVFFGATEDKFCLRVHNFIGIGEDTRLDSKTFTPAQAIVGVHMESIAPSGAYAALLAKGSSEQNCLTLVDSNANILSWWDGFPGLEPIDFVNDTILSARIGSHKASFNLNSHDIVFEDSTNGYYSGGEIQSLRFPESGRVLKILEYQNMGILDMWDAPLATVKRQPSQSFSVSLQSPSRILIRSDKIGASVQVGLFDLLGRPAYQFMPQILRSPETLLSIPSGLTHTPYYLRAELNGEQQTQGILLE